MKSSDANDYYDYFDDVDLDDDDGTMSTTMWLVGWVN